MKIGPEILLGGLLVATSAISPANSEEMRFSTLISQGYEIVASNTNPKEGDYEFVVVDSKGVAFICVLFRGELNVSDGTSSAYSSCRQVDQPKGFK